MRSLGIDIGRHSIKVVEVQLNKRNYEITNAKEYKVLNMETSDQEIEILQTLNSIAKEFDTESAKVTCSIRQQYVSTRKLFFPYKERAKIHKTLAFELEDDIPLSIDKAIYDSKIIKLHEKAAEVVAMACVSEEIERTIEIFEKAHIEPDIITAEFCAIANLYEKWYKPPEEVLKTLTKALESEDLITDDPELSPSDDKMIVHIGHSKSFVGVVSGGNLIWGRSIMWGAEKIAAAISQSFKVPFTTAHDMMPEKAFLLLTTNGANEDQIKMSETVATAFAPLIQSLRLTMMLANTQYGANIASIELIGGPSRIKNLAPYFTQELERPANVTNPILNLDKQFMSNHESLNEVFQMALGLAIEGMRKPFNPAVNFRQMQFAKKNLSFEKFWDKWGYTAKVVSAAYFCYLVYGVAIDSISTQLEEASNDVLITQASTIAKLKGRQATHSKIRSYIKRNNKKAKLVGVYEQLEEVNSPMKFLNEVSQILPSNKDDKSYEIRRFIVKNSEVNIQGVATDASTVTQISKALKGVAADGKVKSIPATIVNEGTKQKFAFTFKVKRKN